MGETLWAGYLTRYARRDTRYGARAGCHHLCKTNPILAGVVLGVTSFQSLGCGGTGRSTSAGSEPNRSQFGSGERREGRGQTAEDGGPKDGKGERGSRISSLPVRASAPNKANLAVEGARIWDLRSQVSNAAFRAAGPVGGTFGFTGGLRALESAVYARRGQT